MDLFEQEPNSKHQMTSTLEGEKIKELFLTKIILSIEEYKTANKIA